MLKKLTQKLKPPLRNFQKVSYWTQTSAPISPKVIAFFNCIDISMADAPKVAVFDFVKQMGEAKIALEKYKKDNAETFKKLNGLVKAWEQAKEDLTKK